MCLPPEISYSALGRNTLNSRVAKIESALGEDTMLEVDILCEKSFAKSDVLYEIKKTTPPLSPKEPSNPIVKRAYTRKIKKDVISDDHTNDNSHIPLFDPGTFLLTK